MFGRRLLTYLLVSTALTAPALAQMEVVTVTAEKRAEDIQTTPIAISAFNSKALEQHQISTFRDLNYAVPNLTYTNTNFGNAEFTIRGLGNAAVGSGVESSVAVHADDVYLENPVMAAGLFYDIDQIEVLRGPQSTLYGRGATGGTVNVKTATPNLDESYGSGEVSYGNYNQTELKGMANIPLVNGELGLRFAGIWQRHDGFVKNIADGADVDGQDTYSFRGSVRWQPADGTTIDLVGSTSRENDSKMRAQKNLCERDPSGVLGCLPNSAGTEALNVNALFPTIISSSQALRNIGESKAVQYGYGALAPMIGTLASHIGLFDLSQPAPAPAADANPSNMREINTDIDPTMKSSENFAALNLKQRLGSWLDATFVGGYHDYGRSSKESFTNIGMPNIDPVRLGTYDATGVNPLGNAPALNSLAAALSFPVVGGSPQFAALFAPYFAKPGQLPMSVIKPNRIGLISGDYTFTDKLTAYDVSTASGHQYSGELRFASSLEGPLNFLVAGYYLRTSSRSDYYVASDVIDYPSIILGSVMGVLAKPPVPACMQIGCIGATPYFHTFARNEDLESKAAFGEVYYDILPDELKITLGARYTEDTKSGRGRLTLVQGGPLPIGTINEEAAADTFQPYVPVGGTTDRWTGRAVLNWTPQVDFSGQTTVYASYARGYKAGGFNTIAWEQPTPGVEKTYKPEGIDAFEVGTKNIFLGNTLQANLTAWYYNYEDLQISSIVSNSVVNSNIGARLWGLEGEFAYAPDSNWAFNLNFGHTSSALGDAQEIDLRNPSAGRSDVVLVKDASATMSTGSNCVLYRLNPAGAATPADAHLPGFFAPPGGSTALAGDGIPYANFGDCSVTSDAVLNAAGFSKHDPRLKGNADNSGGANLSVHGNEIPNTPAWTMSVGGQYTAKMSSGYSLVPRVDFYWQDSSWARIFDDGADRLPSWVQLNAQLTLNAPDNVWYAQLYGKNLAGSDAITGKYLLAADAGLYTNAFLSDPTTYGIRVGAHF